MYSPLKKIKGKKKRQLCDVIEILTNAIVVIIFKQVYRINTLYTLNVSILYGNYISIKLGEKVTEEIS